MRKKLIRILCISATVFFYAAIAQAQLSSDYIVSIPALKNKFPAAELVAVSSTEEYSFKLEDANAGKVSSEMTVNKILVPVKDYPKYTDAIFYNDEIAISNVKAVDGKSKTVKIEPLYMSYQQEGIFHSDAKICLVKIPFEVKGQPVQFTYQSNYRDVKYLTSVYFHEDIPVEKKIVVFKVPDWMEIDLRKFNFEGFSINEKIEPDAASHLTRYTYSIESVPAFKKEYHSPNWARMFPHIIVVCKSITSNGQKKPLMESAKDLYAWYKTLCGDIGNKPADLASTVNLLVKDKKTDIDKVETIFYWVQEKIRYIAFENGIMGFKPQPAQMVFGNKYGDCKGKANLLVQMLKLAGFDARLTWIGTSDLPYDYSLPSLAVDNHMICTLLLNGKKYFLDGTEENIALNDYAHRIQGKQVMIEDGDKFMLDRIPDMPAERNKQTNLYKIRLQENELSGNCVTEYNGESKINLVGAYNSLRTENKKEALSSFLRSGNNNITVSNIKEPDWANRQKPLQIGFDIALQHLVTRAGNELYISMDWEKEFCDLDFDTTRKTDYEMDMKYFVQDQTELQLPEGYKMDYLPAAISIQQNDYSFEGSYQVKGNAIVYTKKIIINKPLLKTSEFASWNDFVKKINSFCREQVVLAKK